MKNLDVLIEQTQRKPEKTIEYKMNKPMETFSIETLLELQENWTIGLTGLEVHKSNFSIEQKKNNKNVTERQSYREDLETIDEINKNWYKRIWN